MICDPFLKMTGGMDVKNITLDSAENFPNQSSCDVFVYQRAAVVLFPIFYSVVFIISACGNSLVLYVICQKKQKFNSTSIYLVNLALSDTLFTLTLPGRITYYIRHFDWPFGDILCRMTTLLFFANTYAGNINASVANTLHVTLFFHSKLYVKYVNMGQQNSVSLRVNLHQTILLTKIYQNRNEMPKNQFGRNSRSVHFPILLCVFSINRNASSLFLHQVLAL